ncbi:ImmA/IrrE family metallo-endopeptidase [Devosia sediminis]|uniref:ImmA/IrrE family metallo-endopeptidase n=1 Tax=Devosia sediminis TaxID=2798801 RepID=A0A934IZM2_9HYPH|nr:ImmA/IrrE family metallo-endopeptidase [Devosia sediminis]MBJ3785623.1 ImmA/IrrE family metallo-endopeptidase [Devosia sediminis]
MTNRRSLLLEANEAAARLREAAGYDDLSPVDIYQVASDVGARVLFVDLSMEGMFSQGTPPRILLSSLRPLARRNFTCAHELGHMVFDHGSTIDELYEDDRPESHQPNEIMANGFAAFMLMPTLGLRSAFARRFISAETASPAEILTIATEFGVGYETLINHLHFTLKDLSEPRKTLLLKSSPKAIREQLFGPSDAVSLALVDLKTSARNIDVEVGHAISLPAGASVAGNAINHVGEYPTFRLFSAVAPGIAKASFAGKIINIRVARYRFAGRAIYRHLEETDEQDD